MPILAVIDTNVLVSSFLSDKESPPSRIINEIFKGTIVPVFSDYLLNEYRTVLSREKFGFEKENVHFLLKSIIEYGIWMEIQSTDLKLDDMKDVPIFEIVLAARSMNTYLITGNVRHFPKSDYVVTPKEMLDILY